MIDLDACFGKPISQRLRDFLTTGLGAPLVGADAERLVLADGRTIPLRRNVPRLVADDKYVQSFSYQWTSYPTEMLDSQQNIGLTEDEIARKTTFVPSAVNGKLMLDAGVGIGRHAEIFARWGAEIVGVDLSDSVDVAYDNLKHFPNTVVLQGDLGELPFPKESFDIIYSIGVLHHTPDTKEYTRRLVPLLKPGGILSIWVYSLTFTRRKQWIPLTSRLPKPAFHDWCDWMIGWLRHDKENPFFRTAAAWMPFRYDHVTHERSVINLFDGYTPTYHGIHSPDEVIGWFQEFGLEDIVTSATDTSVTGRKPA